MRSRLMDINAEQRELFTEKAAAMADKRKKGSSVFLYIAVCTASLLAFACGIAFSWSSPVIPKLNGQVDPELNPLPYPISKEQESWVASFLCLGSAVGPIFTFHLSDKIGRKRTMLLYAVPIVASYLLLSFARDIWIFFVARFMQGFGVATTFSVLPVFIGEVSEKHNRGTLFCLQGMFIAFGLVFSYSLGPYLTIKMFCLMCAVPPCVFLVLFWLFIPESPYYLIAIKDRKAAETSLKKYRGRNDEHVEKELIEITRSVDESFANETSALDLFKSPGVRKAFMISVGLVSFQQLFGVNVVLSYMQSIFTETGSTIPPEISSILMAIVQVFSVGTSTLLVDRLGRRILLVFSATGACVAQASLGIYFYLQFHDHDVTKIFWLPIASLFLFMVAFNMGFGPLPFAMMGELFPPNMKMISTTITSCICLFLAGLVVLVFPYLNAAIGIANSFFLFAGCCALGLVFVYFVVPETKGKSLAEIQKMLEEDTERK